MSFTTLGQIYNFGASSVAVGMPPRTMRFSAPRVIAPDALEAIRNELPQPIAEAIEEANAEPRPPDGFVAYIGGGHAGHVADYWYDDDE